MFIRYAVARLNRHVAELSYRYYFTELMRLQGEGKTYSVSFRDLMDPEPTDDRTAEEIAADVTSMAGLEVRDGATKPPSADNG